MRLRHLLTASLIVLLPGPGLQAQAPEPARDAAELQQALDKLQVLGTVLYVAAHPDDENTAILATFARGRHLRSVYLSMTRGGGGQNLIGAEQGDALAALRTQELLAARRVDGAEQAFTRAVDFGFSKTPEETLGLWGHEPALADVVWTIRRVRPDVIITRFTPKGGPTHGHHTASAILAVEAFKAAADPARFPEQLTGKDRVQPWQAKRIVWNSYRPEAERAAQAPGSFVTLDVGQYDPLLGKSYGELAAESRSMHRSQGFGALASRGPRLEYFEALAGPPARTDLLEDVDLGWGKLPGATGWEPCCTAPGWPTAPSSRRPSCPCSWKPRPPWRAWARIPGWTSSGPNCWKPSAAPRGSGWRPSRTGRPWRPGRP